MSGSGGSQKKWSGQSGSPEDEPPPTSQRRDTYSDEMHTQYEQLMITAKKQCDREKAALIAKFQQEEERLKSQIIVELNRSFENDVLPPLNQKITNLENSMQTLHKDLEASRANENALRQENDNLQSIVRTLKSRLETCENQPQYIQPDPRQMSSTAAYPVNQPQQYYNSDCQPMPICVPAQEIQNPVRYPIENSGKSTSLPVDNSQPRASNFQVDNSQPRSSNLPADNSQPRSSNLPVDNSQPRSSNLPADNSQPISSNLPVDNSPPRSSNLPVDNSQPRSSNLPVDNSQLRPSSLPEDNSQQIRYSANNNAAKQGYDERGQPGLTRDEIIPPGGRDQQNPEESLLAKIEDLSARLRSLDARVLLMQQKLNQDHSQAQVNLMKNEIKYNSQISYIEEEIASIKQNLEFLKSTLPAKKA